MPQKSAQLLRWHLRMFYLRDVRVSTCDERNWVLIIRQPLEARVHSIERSALRFLNKCMKPERVEVPPFKYQSPPLLKGLQSRADHRVYLRRDTHISIGSGADTNLSEGNSHWPRRRRVQWRRGPLSGSITMASMQ